MTDTVRLSPGDHIRVTMKRVWSRTIKHHGIYVGNGRVIHYCRRRGKKMKVRETSLEQFCDGETPHVVQFFPGECDPPDEVVVRAFVSLREGFATQCNFVPEKARFVPERTQAAPQKLNCVAKPFVRKNTTWFTTTVNTSRGGARPGKREVSKCAV